MTFFKRGFCRFLEDSAYSDAIILLEPSGQKFKVHRILLSYHSRYFFNRFKELEQLSKQFGLNRNSTDASVNELSPPYVLSLSLKEKQAPQLFPMILKYMYGGEVEFSQEVEFPLLNIALELKIDSLCKQIEDSIMSRITRDSALTILKQSMELHIERIELKCIATLARNFQVLFDETKLDLNWMPYTTFLTLLRHPNLSINEEYIVYQVIKSYLQTNSQTILSDEQKYALFETVRFPYLNYQQLENVVKDKLVPEDLLAEAIMHRLAQFEAPNLIQNVQLPLRLQARASVGRPFEYSHDFDENGVIYWLATGRKKSPWKNPALTGAIKIVASSIEKGKEYYIVDRPPPGKLPNECWTKDIPSSWFMIDFRKGRALRPTCYTLRHGANSKVDCLRTWLLQGSNDGETWEVLSRHENDQSLNAPFATHTWQLSTSINTPYRFFRILQTGRNSGINNFLALSGIEFYGDLYETHTPNKTKPLNTKPK